VVNAITEEHLKDLFLTETWQDQFVNLSDSLGFSLSIYSQDGTLIFAPMNTPPFCQGFCLTSSSFKQQCESYCHPIMMNAVSKGKPMSLSVIQGSCALPFPLNIWVNMQSSWVMARSLRTMIFENA
jgi:hypothetical protein